jgi:molybdenum cofactor cytidylyltransferase
VNAARPPKHGAIVLAAGASRRLGRAKQLIEVDGEALLRRVARAAIATHPCDAIVVLGDDADRIASALEGLSIRRLRIDDANAGMSASLRAGVAALDADCDGALVVLTDQPALGAAHLEAICAAWRAAPARAVASAYADVLGVPALLPRAWFDMIATLEGDTGARALLRARRDEVVAIAAPDLAHDIDTPDDVTRA